MGNRLSTSKSTKKEEVGEELETSFSQKSVKFMVQSDMRHRHLPSNRIDPPSNPIDPPSNPIDTPSNRIDLPSNPIDPPSNPIDPPSNPIDTLSNPIRLLSNPIDTPSNRIDLPSNPIDTPSNPHSTLIRPTPFPFDVEESEQSIMTSMQQYHSNMPMSNQPSTSNLTNVDEQGHPIGATQYNVQGDLVIKQYQGPPPVDVSALATKPTTESLVQTEIKPTTECLSKTIGPKGGRIEVGGCALIVPAGALDEDVKITLTASLDLDNQTKRILTPTLRCEPSSLQFKLPVTIFLQTHYILDEELLAECKIQTSEDGINWSILQTDLSYIGRTLAFTTNHFTWYEGLLNWIKGKIDILSNVYMKTEKELVWAIHYNLDLNTEQLSENYLTRHNHRFSATKDLTLTIEENKLEKTIKIEPSSTEIKHADLTTKLNQHKPFLIEELPNKDVLLKATLRNEDESREIHFILPKHQSTNQSTTSSNPSNNPGNIILQGIDANHSALFSKNVYIGYRNCGI